MKNITHYLLCGSLMFGLWTALLLAYFHFNHDSKKQEKNQEPEAAWSFEKIGQHTHASEQRSKQAILSDRLEENDHSQFKMHSNLDNDINYTDPQLLDGFLMYGFNAVLSKKLGDVRQIPDTRNKICHKRHYSIHLPTASVIICFHNEEFYALLRTVSSVVYLSPFHLLEEIILVDDMSELDDLKAKLHYHLDFFRGQIKLLRNKKREGLIRSRMIGAAHASGDILVFLDSHCEVNKVWLEPLLSAIRNNYTMVVSPIIDVIHGMTLEYMEAPIVRGAFDWDLRFKWDAVYSYEMEGPEGAGTPIRSPAIAGGIFAIDRHYFNEIGQYDKGMDLWGAENLEFSLRIWMCGGQLFIIPCSRVGHISKNYPSIDPAIMKALVYNQLRLVHVWMDDYKEKFLSRRPSWKLMSYGNISERVELRKRLHCKSFQWYLDTVFPELEASMDS